MWLDNLKELKKSKGMSAKQIAEKTNLPERTVTRIFSGDTDNPYVDTLHRIVTVLGGSLDDILADTKVVVATESLVEVKETLEEVKGTATVMEAQRDLVKIENERLKVENANMATELQLLKKELQHKEELLALHNYYKIHIENLIKKEGI
jgi:transcriptional regulator with XRE-family HTH domain